MAEDEYFASLAYEKSVYSIFNSPQILKALHTGHPSYLSEPLQCHKSTRSTRSSASHLLSVPRHNLSFGSHAFRISAPKTWNILPFHILQSQTLSSFRRHLKTHLYFQSAYPAFYQAITHPSRALIFFCEFGAINHLTYTYVLTRATYTCITFTWVWRRCEVNGMWRCCGFAGCRCRWGTT